MPFGITDWGARGTAGQTIDPAYLCRSVPKPDLSNSGAWNSAHWCNQQFDTLVEQFEGESDEQKRKDLAIQAAKIQQDEVPDVIAYWIHELRARRKTSTASPPARRSISTPGLCGRRESRGGRRRSDAAPAPFHPGGRII